MIEYPFFPAQIPRGSIDGGRLYNIFAVKIINNEVYYTHDCTDGMGRVLTALAYQPIYLVLLTKLYKKYISDIDYTITMNYTPQKFINYPDISTIPCITLPADDTINDPPLPPPSPP